MWIGKQGCSDTLIEEIRLQIKQRKAIKIKWLRSTEVDADDIARRAGAELVGVRGRTMVLAEKRKGSRPA